MMHAAVCRAGRFLSRMQRKNHTILYRVQEEKFIQFFLVCTLRKLYFHFLSQGMGYDRGDGFRTKWKFHLVQKLSPRSYPIHCERKWKYSFLICRRKINPIQQSHTPRFRLTSQSANIRRNSGFHSPNIAVSNSGRRQKPHGQNIHGQKPQRPRLDQVSFCLWGFNPWGFRPAFVQFCLILHTFTYYCYTSAIILLVLNLALELDIFHNVYIRCKN